MKFSKVDKFLSDLEAGQELYTQNYVDEKDKEIERLKNDIKRITEITNQKIKIINDVREYAEEIIDFVGDVSWVEIPSEDYIKEWQDILEILDKKENK